jgi:formylglycine-generating enzyme required for sulfatase activity
MARIQVYISDTLRDLEFDMELPDDLPMAQLLPTLVRDLALPKGPYKLAVAGAARPLAGDTTLAEAGVGPGAQLRFARKEPADMVEDLLAELFSRDSARAGNNALAQLREWELDPDGPLYHVLREMLAAETRDPAVSIWQRASAGEVLAMVGDPRFRADAWSLPDLPLVGYLEIPEGPFLMGEGKDQHEVTLPTYYLAIYPVTVAQYQAFMDETGFAPADEDGWWNQDNTLDNHPVEWVNWHDALAYCAWLTETLRGWRGTPEPLATLLRDRGWQVAIPSEAEWEKAARGAEGRAYPWGDEPDRRRANYWDTGLGRSCAAGCFPDGASSYGVEELSGSVWEWTRSLHRAYPYRADDGREALDADGERVIRGGSYRSARRFIGCTYRTTSAPTQLRPGQGLRTAIVGPLP